MLIHATDRTASDQVSDDHLPMERTDLLIALLAFGAAVSSLTAWVWAAFVQTGHRQR